MGEEMKTDEKTVEIMTSFNGEGKEQLKTVIDQLTNIMENSTRIDSFDVTIYYGPIKTFKIERMDLNNPKPSNESIFTIRSNDVVHYKSGIYLQTVYAYNINANAPELTKAKFVQWLIENHKEGKYYHSLIPISEILAQARRGSIYLRVGEIKNGDLGQKAARSKWGRYFEAGKPQ